MAGLTSPYKAINPYEPDQDIQLPQSDWVVHDGDTIKNIRTGEHVRLTGANAREMYNPAKHTPRQVTAREATESLANYLADTPPEVQRLGVDPYGRTIADVSGASVNQIRNLSALPTYFGNEPDGFKAKAEAARWQGINDLYNGVSSPINDRLNQIPVAGPDAYITKPPTSHPESLLGDAFRRGTDLMQSNLYGGAHAAARAVQEDFGVDTQGIQNWAQSGVDRNLQEAAQNPQKFKSWDDVHGVGDFLGYTGERMVENLPQQVPMLVAGAAAAAAAPEVAVGAGVTALGRLGATIVGKKAATMSANALQKTGAGILGGFAGNTVGQAGEVENEIGGKVPADEVLAASVPRAALDTLSDLVGARLALGAAGTKNLRDFAGQILAASGAGAVSEGSTEVAQDAISMALRARHDEGYDPFAPEELARLKETAISAGVVGMGMSGMGRAGGMLMDSATSPAIQDPNQNLNPAQGQDLNTAEQAQAQASGPVPPAATTQSVKSGAGKVRESGVVSMGISPAMQKVRSEVVDRARNEAEMTEDELTNESIGEQGAQAVVNDVTDYFGLPRAKVKTAPLAQAASVVTPEAKAEVGVEDADTASVDDTAVSIGSSLGQEAADAEGLEQQVANGGGQNGAERQLKNSVKPKTLNVFWGTGENKELSNLAPRSFEYNGKRYQSVEHAYQTLKSGKFNESTYLHPVWSKEGGIIKSRGTDHSITDALMEDLIRESIRQNPKSREFLMKTGNAILTHNQDRGHWKAKFPEILMKIRDEEFATQGSEQRTEPPTVAPKMTMPMKFKDGQAWAGVSHVMRPELKGKDTFGLTVSGQRKATTRSAKPEVVVGDVIRMTDGVGNSVDVRVTSKPYQLALTNDPAVDEANAEAWSQLEGWAPSVYKAYARKGAWQFQYETIPNTLTHTKKADTKAWGGAFTKGGVKKEPLTTTPNSETSDVATRMEASKRKSSYFSKDLDKAKKANKFIGFGSKGTSTEAYAEAIGDLANTGQYEASDKVFVSMNGDRASGRVSLANSPALAKELDMATKAGATIITDVASDRNRPFNIGERELANYLSKHGYVENKGVWTPSKPTAKPTAKPKPKVEVLERNVNGVYIRDDNTIYLAQHIIDDLNSTDVVVQTLAMETLLHEVGHLAFRTKYAELEREAKTSAKAKAIVDAIEADYKKFLAETEGKNPIMAEARRNTPLRGRVSAITSQLGATRDGKDAGYSKTKHEWLADEAAKYLMNPESIDKWSAETQSFIKRLAAFIQTLLNKAREYYSPGSTGVKSFFEELAERQEVVREAQRQQEATKFTPAASIHGPKPKNLNGRKPAAVFKEIKGGKVSGKYVKGLRIGSVVKVGKELYKLTSKYEKGGDGIYSATVAVIGETSRDQSDLDNYETKLRAEVTKLNELVKSFNRDNEGLVAALEALGYEFAVVDNGEPEFTVIDDRRVRNPAYKAWDAYIHPDWVSEAKALADDFYHIETSGSPFVDVDPNRKDYIEVASPKVIFNGATERFEITPTLPKLDKPTPRSGEKLNDVVKSEEEKVAAEKKSLKAEKQRRKTAGAVDIADLASVLTVSDYGQLVNLKSLLTNIVDSFSAELETKPTNKAEVEKFRAKLHELNRAKQALSDITKKLDEAFPKGKSHWSESFLRQLMHDLEVKLAEISNGKEIFNLYPSQDTAYFSYRESIREIKSRLAALADDSFFRQVEDLYGAPMRGQGVEYDPEGVEEDDESDVMEYGSNSQLGVKDGAQYHTMFYGKNESQSGLKKASVPGWSSFQSTVGVLRKMLGREIFPLAKDMNTWVIATSENVTADEVANQDQYYEIRKRGNTYIIAKNTFTETVEGLDDEQIKAQIRAAIKDASHSRGRSLLLVQNAHSPNETLYIDAPQLTNVGRTMLGFEMGEDRSLDKLYAAFSTALGFAIDKMGLQVPVIPNDLVLVKGSISLPEGVTAPRASYIEKMTMAQLVDKSIKLSPAERDYANQRLQMLRDSMLGAKSVFEGKDGPITYGRAATARKTNVQSGQGLEFFGSENEAMQGEDVVDHLLGEDEFAASKEEVDEAKRRQARPNTDVHELPKPDKRIAGVFTSRTTEPKLHQYFHELAKILNIKSKFVVIDTGTREQFLADLRALSTTIKDKKRLSAINATITQLANATGSIIVYNDKSSVVEDRIPIIYVATSRTNGSQKSMGRQVAEAAHEFGHLIKRLTVDQLIEQANANDKAATDLLKSMFGDVNWNSYESRTRAEEKFANNVMRWTLTNATPVTAAQKFFKSIGDQLKRMYNWLKARFTSAEDRKEFQSLEKFLEAMMRKGGVDPLMAEAAELDNEIAEMTHTLGYHGNLDSELAGRVSEASQKLPMLQLKRSSMNLRKSMANSYVTDTARTYQEIVDSLTMGDYAPRSKGVDYHNFTIKDVVNSTANGATAAKNWGQNKPVLGSMGKALGGMAELAGLLGEKGVAVVPRMYKIHQAVGEIGAHYQTLPGKSTFETMTVISLNEAGRIAHKKVPFVPVYIQQRQVRSALVDFAKYENGIATTSRKALIEHMVDVLEGLPKLTFKDMFNSAHRQQVADEYKSITRHMIDYTLDMRTFDRLTDVEKNIANYFKMMNDYFSKSDQYSIRFKERKAYYPLTIDKMKWIQNKAEVLKALVKHGFSPADADTFYAAIEHSHGIIDQSLVDEVVLASGVNAKHSRKLSLDLQRDLHKIGVYSDDIHHTVKSYTHQIIKRAVEQSRFGDYKKVWNPNLKGRNGQKGGFEYLKVDGKYIFDPMGQVNNTLEDLRYRHIRGLKGISAQEYTWLRTKAFPALRGNLGGDIDPRVNALMDWTMFGLNVVMLPLSVLSQFPDLAGIANMKGRTVLQPGKALGDLLKVSKLMLDKGLYTQLKEVASITGSIESRLVNSVLSESMANEYVTPSVQKWSETFFNIVQMKRFTDFSRIVATQFALDTLNEYADNPTGKVKYLRELHLSREALAAWDTAGRPIDSESLMRHDQIRVAIAQWTDFAVLRPSAAMRPVIGSDPRWKLFWHLKDYLYAYYYTAMQRAWVNMKDDSNFRFALPMISLGVFSMALALAGYELRKLLTQEVMPEMFGIDGQMNQKDNLFAEGVERSGIMGPGAIIYDMLQAEKRGSTALAAFMGPAFSKLMDFSDKDLPTFIAGNVPISAQSAPIRTELRLWLKEWVPDEIIPKG